MYPIDAIKVRFSLRRPLYIWILTIGNLDSNADLESDPLSSL